MQAPFNTPSEDIQEALAIANLVCFVMFEVASGFCLPVANTWGTLAISFGLLRMIVKNKFLY